LERAAMSIRSTGLSSHEREYAPSEAIATARGPPAIKTLAVTVKTARQVTGLGNTTMWALIKSGRVKTVSIGRRRLVVYASLESLVGP